MSKKKIIKALLLSADNVKKVSYSVIGTFIVWHYAVGWFAVGIFFSRNDTLLQEHFVVMIFCAQRHFASRAFYCRSFRHTDLMLDRLFVVMHLAICYFCMWNCSSIVFFLVSLLCQKFILNFMVVPLWCLHTKLPADTK